MINPEIKSAGYVIRRGAKYLSNGENGKETACLLKRARVFVSYSAAKLEKLPFDVIVPIEQEIPAGFAIKGKT